MKKNLKFVPAAVASVIVAALISYFMYLIGPALTSAAEASGQIALGLGAQTEQLNNNGILGALIYLMGDLSEGNFYADVLGSIFMLLGGFLAVYLQRTVPALGGTGAMNKTWMWLVSAQLAAAFLAAQIWRMVWPDTWLCSFTPMVAITPFAVLAFGKPNIQKWITGVVLGALIVPPACQLWMNNIMTPMGWPVFAGCLGIVMPICSVIGREIMNVLPWMHTDDPADEDEFDDTPVSAPATQSATSLALQRIWGGDSSELYFWGSNISWIFLTIGWFISYLLNPANVSFSIYAFFITILTSAVAMVIWGPKFQETGYVFTCAGILISVGLLGSCGQNVILAVVITVVAAIVGPAWCTWAGKQKFFQRYLACVYLQFGTAVISLIIFYICKLAGFFA